MIAAEESSTGDLSFSWRIDSFTKDQVSLKIKFESPLSVSSSSGERDMLRIKVKEAKIFRDKHG